MKNNLVINEFNSLELNSNFLFPSHTQLPYLCPILNTKSLT